MARRSRNQLFGGHNTAGTTSLPGIRTIPFGLSGGTPGIEFSLTGTPTILPYTTNVGHWGPLAIIGATSTRRITCSRSGRSLRADRGSDSKHRRSGAELCVGGALVANGGSADPLFQSLNLASSNAVGSSILPVGNEELASRIRRQNAHDRRRLQPDALAHTSGERVRYWYCGRSRKHRCAEVERFYRRHANDDCHGATSVPSTGRICTRRLESSRPMPPRSDRGLGATTQGTPAGGATGSGRSSERRSLWYLRPRLTGHLLVIQYSPVLDGAGQPFSPWT